MADMDGCDEISIHAPHTGRDLCVLETISTVILFQSTRPIRGATCGLHELCKPPLISIHAPHTGRDMYLRDLFGFVFIFQSTRPIRGATITHS